MDKPTVSATHEQTDGENRRKFLAKVAGVAVTAPAAAMLLAASSKTAMAQVASGAPTTTQQIPE